MAFDYGRNVGIAFQIVDDYLDFVSSADMLGKPAMADLKLGLATAPVLFASQKFPHLTDLIRRRFNHPGDVETALNYVINSDGLEKTKNLAEQYKNEALDNIKTMKQSEGKLALEEMAEKIITRIN